MAETKRSNSFRMRELPTELIIDILLMALDETTWGPEDLGRLTAVCDHWRDIIVNRPQFWRTLDARHGRRAWFSFVAMNPEGPLDVRIGGLRAGHQIGWMDEPRFLDFNRLIEQELNRVRSITLSGSPYMGYVQSFFKTGPLLLLSDVTIIMSEDMPTPPLFDPGDGIPFRHLHLSGVVVPWDSTRLRGLESLTLWGISFRKGPSFSELHHVLSSSSPRLRRLSLFKWTYESFSQAQALPPIKLPFLMSLAISSIAEPMNSRLLSMIEAPGLTKICWLSVRGSTSGAALLRLSTRCIRKSLELVIHWTGWSKRLVIRSEPWLDSMGSPKPSLEGVGKTVDIGIDGIEEPSHFIGTIATLSDSSSKVLFKTNSEELIPHATETFRNSGATVDIRLSTFTHSPVVVKETVHLVASPSRLL